MTTDLREGFEAWLNSKFISLDGGLNEFTGEFEYAYPHVQSMWIAWQAALAFIRQHDGHAEFVRAVKSILLMRIDMSEMLNEIESLCDRASCSAELAKGKSK